MRGFIASTVAGFLVVSTSSAADELKFNSYGEALNLLLAPDNDDYDPPYPPSGGPTSCPLIAENSNQLNGLGENLRRNCKVSENGAYGSTRSLGFSSNIPTSTFLPFTLDQTRSSDNNGGSQTASPPRKNFLATKSSEGGTSVSFLIYGQDLDIDETAYEPRQDEQTIRVGVAVERLSRNGGRTGFVLGFGQVENQYQSPDEIDNDSPSGSDAFDFGYEDGGYQRYSDACDTVSAGKSDSSEIVLAAYHIMPVSSVTQFEVHGGAKRTRDEYRHDLCYFTVQSNLNDPLYAGRIKGKSKSYSFFFGGSISSQFDVGSVRFRPQLSLDYEHTNRPGYSETESEIASVTNALPGETVPTGASLKYERQEYDSLVARLGGTANIRAGQSGLLSLGLFYVKDFYDNPRTVNAQFVEDGRNNPVKFSFKTNPPASDYFELGIGYFYSSRRQQGLGFQVGASTILGDDTYSGYALFASLTHGF